MKLDPCYVKSWSTSGDAIDLSDSFIFEGDGLAVDPNNPNIELQPAETPGPDDLPGLPAVQKGVWIMDATPATESHALYQDLLLPF